MGGGHFFSFEKAQRRRVPAERVGAAHHGNDGIAQRYAPGIRRDLQKVSILGSRVLRNGMAKSKGDEENGEHHCKLRIANCELQIEMSFALVMEAPPSS